jgi:N-acyl-D-aspartate/D-glutamate deacylase
MKSAMEKSMQDGALGLSTGLIYAPGCFAETSEIVELAKIASKFGGIYASHIRDERDLLEEAIEETLTIGEQANINVLISHLKSAEKRNFGKIGKVLTRLEEYNKSHKVKAKIDVYPYTAVSTKLRAFIPKHILADGIENVPERLGKAGTDHEIAAYIDKKGYNFDQMLFISNGHSQWEGKSIAEIAQGEGWSMAKTLVEILSEDTEVWIVYFCIDEKDMDAAICWSDAMICTDSWSHPINAPHRIGLPHPRSYGAFTQFIYDYVKTKKLLSFHEAVRKITSMPANYFNLKDRGIIKQGNIADLVLLNLEKLEPKATYTQPMQLSEGVEYVWVNGVAVIEGGEINDKKPGSVILNQHYNLT